MNAVYKKIGKFSFKGYSFVTPIEEKFNYFANEIMNKFVFGIYKSFIEHSSKWNPTQKIQLLDVLQKEEYINLEKLEEYQALQILAQILKLEMEEYLKVPLDELDVETEKKNHITFREFESSEISNFDFKQELEKVFRTNTNTNEFTPEYFKLFRARNLILSTFSKRIYSEKTLSKVTERIFESFIEDLNFLIIKGNISYIESKNSFNIADRVTKDYIRHFLNHQQIGKTMPEGESLKRELDEKIFESGAYIPLLNKVAYKFGNTLKDLLNEASYIEFSRELIKEIECYLEEITGVKESSLHIIKFEDFKKFILGEIILEVESFDKILEAAYEEYTNEMIVNRILQVQKDYLSLSKFEIALRVNNLSIKDSLFYLNINEDIEAVSHDLFKSWQYEKYKELNQEKPLIIDVSEEDKEDSMWFIIKNLDCANKDEEIAYIIAKEKLETHLEFYYYFMSKEDEYNFKIDDPYIIFNKTSKRMYVGRKNKFLNRKYFDEFPKELIEFPNKVLQSNIQLGSNLIQSIRLYYSTMNESSVLKKSQNLIEILETIFDTNDYKILAKYASIVIAGTNYNKSDITYGQMRQVVFEDFCNFINYTSSQSSILVLEESFERFKAFTKNIIGTYLFNLSFDEQNGIIDVLKWILYINPNNELIKSGVTKND